MSTETLTVDSIVCTCSYSLHGRTLQRVTSLRRRAQANAPAASCRGRRRVPRLDESIVQGVPGAEPGIHHCLVFCNFIL